METLMYSGWVLAVVLLVILTFALNDERQKLGVITKKMTKVYDSAVGAHWDGPNQHSIQMSFKNMLLEEFSHDLRDKLQFVIDDTIQQETARIVGMRLDEIGRDFAMKYTDEHFATMMIESINSSFLEKLRPQPPVRHEAELRYDRQ